MQTFKQNVEENEKIEVLEEIKKRKHLRTVAYTYPIGVGGAYYGTNPEPVTAGNGNPEAAGGVSSVGSGG